MIRVARTRLSGMYVRYTAWEPTSGGDALLSDSHSAVTYDEQGNLLGQVGHRRLPAAVDALPSGPRRDEAIERFVTDQYETAYVAILATFPEAALGERLRGTIDTPRCKLRGQERAAIQWLGAEIGAQLAVDHDEP